MCVNLIFHLINIHLEMEDNVLLFVMDKFGTPKKENGKGKINFRKKYEEKGFQIESVWMIFY